MSGVVSPPGEPEGGEVTYVGTNIDQQAPFSAGSLGKPTTEVFFIEACVKNLTVEMVCRE